MNFQRLKYFIEVARTKNFTQAAHNLYISQPALSKQISLLEEELGTILISRNTKSFKLTFAGEILEKEGAELIKHSEDIIHHLRIAGKIETHPLDIGTTTTWASIILSPLISKYRKTHPNISFNLRRMNFSAITKGLTDSSLVLGIARVENLSALDEWEYHVLSTSKLAFVCKKTHRLAKKDVITFPDLKGEPVVVMRSQYGKRIYHDDLIKLCEKYSFVPNIINEYDLIETLLFIVESCDYVTTIASDLEPSLPSNLIMKEIEDAPQMYNVALWKKEDYKVDYIRSFIDDITRIEV